MIKDIKEFFIDFKWYIISGGLILASIYLIFFTKEGDKAVDDLYDWVIKKRGKMVKDKIELKRDEVDDYEGKIKKIDEKIKVIEDKKEETDSNARSKTLKELTDTWKDLGY